jgi:putative flippase GtrA
MVGVPGPLFRIIRDQRVAFLVVGFVNTVVGLLWFIVFDALIGSLLGYMVTLLVSHVASVLCAFVLYRRFVFRVRGNMLIDLLRFELVYLVALAINAITLPILVEWARLPVLLAQALIVGLTTLVSFFGHSRFSFRRRAGENG